MSEELVSITLVEYARLKADQRKLEALERAGVDNWEWYGDAMQTLEDEQGDE